MASTTSARRGPAMKVISKDKNRSSLKTTKEAANVRPSKVVKEKELKSDKVVKSTCHGFEIVVVVCRKCKEATEIMRCEGGRLSCTEYYCCAGYPLEIHSLFVPPA